MSRAEGDGQDGASAGPACEAGLSGDEGEGVQVPRADHSEVAVGETTSRSAAPLVGSGVSSAGSEMVAQRVPDDLGDGHAVSLRPTDESLLELGIESDRLHRRGF